MDIVSCATLDVAFNRIVADDCDKRAREFIRIRECVREIAFGDACKTNLRGGRVLK
jgi:Ni,Fe-hydrogenase III large subunit